VKIVLTEDRIRAGVAELARQLNADYAGRPVTLLGVMTGSLVLLADLIRLLEIPLRVGVVRASSYRTGTERGELRCDEDFWPEVQGQDLLLIDDIFDTGHTLVGLCNRFHQLAPRSLRTAVLLRKQGRQEVDFTPDYVAFEIPDAFVVGYGLDYRDRFRNLPYVAELEAADVRDLEV
jgi:hypoxanthine phosphoribosyltransferase